MKDKHVQWIPGTPLNRATRKPVMPARVGFDISDIGDAVKGIVDVPIDFVKDPGNSLKELANVDYDGIVKFADSQPLIKDTPTASVLRNGTVKDALSNPVISVILFAPAAGITGGLAIAKIAKGDKLAGAAIKSFVEVLQMAAKFFSAGQVDLDTSSISDSLTPDMLKQLGDLASKYGDQLSTAYDTIQSKLGPLGLPGLDDLDYTKLASKLGISQFSAATALMGALNTDQAADDFAKLRWDANGNETSGTPFGYHLAPDGALWSKQMQLGQGYAKANSGSPVTTVRKIYANNTNAVGLPASALPALKEHNADFLTGFDFAVGMKVSAQPPAVFQRGRFMTRIGPERNGFDTATVAWDGLVKSVGGSAARARQVTSTLGGNATSRQAAGAVMAAGFAGQPAVVKANAAPTLVADSDVKKGASAVLLNQGWFAKLMSWMGL